MIVKYMTGLFLLCLCIQVASCGYCASMEYFNESAVLAVCHSGVIHNELTAFLESDGNEETGIYCECIYEQKDNGNFRLTLESTQGQGSEFRVNNVTYNSPVNIASLYHKDMTLIVFKKTTNGNTTMSCLRIISGIRFNLTCNERSSEPQTTIKGTESMAYNVITTTAIQGVSSTSSTETTTQSVLATTATQGKPSSSSGSSQTPLSQTSEDTTEDSGISIVIIAGAAGGGAFVLILIIVITAVCLRKKKSPKQMTQQNQEESQGEADYYMSDNAHYISADTIKANIHTETNTADIEGPEYAVPMKAYNRNKHDTQATPGDTDYAHYASPRDTYMNTNGMPVPSNTIHNTEPKFYKEQDKAHYAMVNPSQRGREGNFGQKRSTDIDNYNHLNEVIQKPETGNFYNTISNVQY